MTRAGSSGAVPELHGEGLRIGIVSARFNDHIVTNLRDGALRGLERCGVRDNDIVEHWVPGAFEVPLAAKALAQSGTVDAIICLGTVIRGDTPHFEYVCEAATHGILDAQMSTGVPVMFGVLTLNTEQQAIDRSGPGIDSKGDEAAMGAVEMARLTRKLAVIPADWGLSLLSSHCRKSKKPESTKKILTPCSADSNSHVKGSTTAQACRLISKPLPLVWA